METSGPSRKALRWKLWDYSTPGDYFVTICTDGKGASVRGGRAWTYDPE